MRHAAAWTAGTTTAIAGTAAAGYLSLVTAAVPIDLGIGRRHLPLGPHIVDIAAPRDIVFDILATPYLGRQTRAMADKIQILERGTDMVLAAHRTPIGRGLIAVETVRFTRPDRVDFRLVRGPVPDVTEQFLLTEPSGDQQVTRLSEDTEAITPGARSCIAPAAVSARDCRLNGVTRETEETPGTDVTEDRDHAEPELSAADEQVLRELTERARTGGLKLTGEGGLLGRLTKMVIEGALEGELDDHLG